MDTGAEASDTAVPDKTHDNADRRNTVHFHIRRYSIGYFDIAEEEFVVVVESLAEVLRTAVVVDSLAAVLETAAVVYNLAAVLETVAVVDTLAEVFVDSPAVILGTAVAADNLAEVFEIG